MLPIIICLLACALVLSLLGIYLSECQIGGKKYFGLLPSFLVLISSVFATIWSYGNSLLVGIPILLGLYLWQKKAELKDFSDTLVSTPRLKEIAIAKIGWYLATLVLIVAARIYLQIDFAAKDFQFAFHDSYYYSNIMNGMVNHHGEYSSYQADVFLATGEAKHTLYHYLELWFGALVASITIINFAEANDLLVHPLLLWLIFIFVFEVGKQKGNTNIRAGLTGLLVAMLPGILFIDNVIGEGLHLPALTELVTYHPLSMVGSSKNTLTFLWALYTTLAYQKKQDSELFLLVGLAPFINAALIPVVGLFCLFFLFTRGWSNLKQLALTFTPFILSAALTIGTAVFGGHAGEARQEGGIVNDAILLIQQHATAPFGIITWWINILVKYLQEVSQNLLPILAFVIPVCLLGNFGKNNWPLALGVLLAPLLAIAPLQWPLLAIIIGLGSFWYFRKSAQSHWKPIIAFLAVSGLIIKTFYELMLYNMFDSKQIYSLAFFLFAKAFLVSVIINEQTKVKPWLLVILLSFASLELYRFMPLEVKKWQARSAYARADIKSIALSLPRFTKIGTLESIKDPKYLYNEQQWYPFVHYNDAISFHAVGTNQVDAKTFQAIVANKTTSVLDNIPINHFSKNHPDLSSDQATIEFMRTYGFSYLSAEDTLLERHHTYLKPYLGKILAKGTRDGNGFTFYELKP